MEIMGTLIGILSLGAAVRRMLQRTRITVYVPEGSSSRR